MLRKLRDKAKQRALRRTLGDYDLPSFSAAVADVLDLVRSKDATAGAVAKTLAIDPGLSVRVLSTVNSAAYAPRKKVENLQQAVVMLGMSNVEMLVLAAAVRGSTPAVNCPGFDPGRFWLSAARRAATARGFANLLHPAMRSESFTAGLLQNLAIPFLSRAKPELYGKVLQQWQAGDADLASLEKEALGVDHATVGGWLCEAWDLPEALQEAIEDHHIPQGQETRCPPAVALVANIPDTDDPEHVETLVAAAVEQYGLPTETVTELVEESYQQADELAKVFTR